MIRGCHIDVTAPSCVCAPWARSNLCKGTKGSRVTDFLMETMENVQILL